MRDGKPKYDICIRVLSGCPYTYDVCMQALSGLLSKYDTVGNKHQTRDKKKNQLNFRFQFTIGRTARARTYSDKTYFRFKHNFRDNIGIYSINETELADPLKAKTKSAEQKDLYYMAGKLLNTIDSGYAAGGHWVVQIHAMDHDSKINKHKDTNDITFQYGVTLGDYEGGNLVTWDSCGENPSEIKVQNKVVKLDGRLFHQVTPVVSGIRYSLYYYKVYDPMITEVEPIFEPARIISMNM